MPNTSDKGSPVQTQHPNPSPQSPTHTLLPIPPRLTHGLLALFICLLQMLSACQCQPPPDAFCVYGKLVVKEGASVLAEDGCNSCTCTKGLLTCTQKQCLPKACNYKNTTVLEGASVPAEDGCNSCTCKTGKLSCTTQICPSGGCKFEGKLIETGSTFPKGDGCNTCTCDGTNIQCTQKKCPATAQCGTPTLPSCPPHQFCDKAGHCGETSTPGVCKDKPTRCSDTVSLVCACSGTTFTNQCFAHQNGNSVRLEGTCTNAPKGCEYAKQTHPHQASFPAVDGCNTCLCNDGIVVCSELPCDKKSCRHEGRIYAEGDAFYAKDGCNLCTCKAEKITCTQNHCPSSCKVGNRILKHGERYHTEDGCKRCTCLDGVHSCIAWPCSTRTCTHAGKTYKEGDNFPIGDGCNNCICSNGQPICSQLPCPIRFCTFLDNIYPDGAVIPVGDNCNVCTCKAGQLSCTQKQCTPDMCDPNGRFPCPKGTFCNRTPHCGRHTLYGLCTTIPTQCPPKSEPICGCNDTTYQNACTANASGVSVKYEGPCAALKRPCLHEQKTYAHGSSFPKGDGCNNCTCDDGQVQCTQLVCQPNGCDNTGRQRCKSTEFCDGPKHCFAAGTQSGTCRTTPLASQCPKTLDPVCGCDDKDYDNPCLAYAATISIKQKGYCKPIAPCNINGTIYQEGDTFAAPDQCNICTCEKASLSCTKDTCTKTPCDAQRPCPSGQFCMTGPSCQTTPTPGICLPKTTRCPPLSAPVCGCNGRTFLNACYAFQKGISVLKKGPCSP